MAEPGCETCAFRGRYDSNPNSWLGRLWRWHINFCPGWKKYMETVPEEKRLDLANRYQLKKYL